MLNGLISYAISCSLVSLIFTVNSITELAITRSGKNPTSPFQHHPTHKNSRSPTRGTETMDSDDESPLFAFHDLDYIPYGVGGSTAPYIETPAATMRAAATLMRLGLGAGAEVASTHQEPVSTVVCDLGCGDGDFRTYAFPLFPLRSRATPPMHRHYLSRNNSTPHG